MGKTTADITEDTVIKFRKRKGGGLTAIINNPNCPQKEVALTELEPDNKPDCKSVTSPAVEPE